jgi:hypothetical protein
MGPEELAGIGVPPEELEAKAGEIWSMLNNLAARDPTVRCHGGVSARWTNL